MVVTQCVWKREIEKEATEEENCAIWKGTAICS